MKKISFSETQEFKNSDCCIAMEYDFQDKDIDVATATICGRYPEDAYCVNTKVKELIYVLDGGEKSIKKTR